MTASASDPPSGSATAPKRTVPANLKRRGRGALSNRTGRFEALERVAVDDGWELPEEEALLRTEVTTERPRRVISRNESPDIPFDRSINPYRGCEHGCIYCFARPTHAWLGMSAGLDFETRLIARPGAAEVLRRELAAPSYRVAPIAIGTVTDPYQPLEGRLRVTGAILEVLEEFAHPVSIVTKGTLIEHDAALLGRMGRRALAWVGVSIATLDARLARRLDPRAPSPARRLRVIARLAAAGCPVRLMVAPVIPGLTDHELERILAAGARAGAVAASWIMLRLPREVAPLFEEWLQRHCPARAGRVLARLREIHGGRLYDPRWGRRMRGGGEHARLIARRFALALARNGLSGESIRLRRDLFRVPGRGTQLPLL